ncbi:hypothetical protein JOF56_009104 [Kibdelosporangium banguiense]|uniref:Uncharacterized protein n=1 Tax=Kibdelosporangium banguiense TaxID=1365924 RepID=A0ABS4TXJ8_9PSEU|nr:hypothetical protein [Kibdelosporangium banguiense]MBP2328719.1 hypothetical protein [Kibdelosporangium banguiense]
MPVIIRTRPDGTKYPIRVGGGGKIAVAATFAAAVLAGGGQLGLTATTGGAGNSVAGNLTGDVADSLPGRDLRTRKTEGRKSAQRGRSDEAWSRMKFKELKRNVEHRLECVAASTGKVREFLLRTPCTSLDGLLFLVGDGQGNAAVVSVVRIGFRTKAQANAFQKVEDIGESGDVFPWNVATALDLANVSMTGHHYHLRTDKTAKIIGEADVATGSIDKETLLALAEVASYLPTK